MARILYMTKRVSKSGFVCDITVYEAEGDCNDCPLKSLCTKAKGNRKIHVSKDFLELRNESLSRITSSDLSYFHFCVCIFDKKRACLH